MGKHQAAHRLPLAHEIVRRFRRLAFRRRSGLRIAATIAGAARRIRFVFAGRFEDGVQPHLPRIPHMETLSRRHGG